MFAKQLAPGRAPVNGVNESLQVVALALRVGCWDESAVLPRSIHVRVVALHAVVARLNVSAHALLEMGRGKPFLEGSHASGPRQLGVALPMQIAVISPLELIDTICHVVGPVDPGGITDAVNSKADIAELHADVAGTEVTGTEVGGNTTLALPPTSVFAAGAAGSTDGGFDLKKIFRLRRHNKGARVFGLRPLVMKPAAGYG